MEKNNKIKQKQVKLRQNKETNKKKRRKEKKHNINTYIYRETHIDKYKTRNYNV